MADDVLEYREWQVPPAAAPESKKIGWINEVCDEGVAWCKSQRGYPDWKRALDVISGRDDLTQAVASYRSKVATNRLKRNIQEITGTLAKLRPMWGYYSDNKAYTANAEMFNKVARFWYLKQAADRAVHDALDYAAATGRGWLIPRYRREMYGTGKGDIKLFAFGAPCVLPCQLPQNNDYQSAYAVTILEEMPVAMAHGMFPLHQNRLRPTSSRYWYMNDGVRQATTGNWLSRAFGKVKRTANDTALSDLLVPIRYTYILDLSINTTDKEMPMGDYGSTWSYIVPAYKQRIPTGLDFATGQPTYREANENDARLYPHRRLIISSDTAVLYDGPAFDWHGMFPGVSFCLDAWPWEPLGFSLVHGGYEIQNAINEIARGCMDKIRATLKPGLGFDINAVAQKDAERYDPFQPNARVAYDGGAVEGTPFQPTLPPEFLKVEPEYMAMWDKLESTLDDQQAVRDAMALAKIRAGGTDDLEKVLEANGPIIENMSRSMEPPMRDLGIMVKYDIMQYYTTPRVMKMIGADNVTLETLDYDPASLVPSHVAGENPERPSIHNAAQRARILADNLEFYIMPNTLHEMQQMTMKLGLIQLKKATVKIDSQTIAESWNVPNYGTIDGNTVMERWQNEQEMDLEFAARMQAIAGEVGLGGGSPGATTSPQKKQEGRPPSGQAAPKLQSKDGGARSTITES